MLGFLVSMPGFSLTTGRPLMSRPCKSDTPRDNGFLRYWTICNIPLFLFASPMLCIMFSSSWWAWTSSRSSPRGGALSSPDCTAYQAEGPPERDVANLLPIFALPQLILAGVTFTSSHVQIITRLSSGYPVWYWWLACLLLSVTEGGKTSFALGRTVLKWMIMYAVLQGALFASFLPPA